MIKKQKILITGSNGLLGSTLAKVFKNGDYEICGLDLPIDITKKQALRDYIKPRLPFDHIVHTAALTDVDFCEANHRLCYKVNVEGTKNVVDLAKEIKAKLIYISTVSVFSGKKGNYKETDIPYPKNFYSLTKFLGEYPVLEYNKGLVLRINFLGQ